MIGELPRTETIDAAAVRAGWEDALDRVAAGETRLLIERDGRPVAALIAADDFQVFERLDKQRREARAVLEQSWQAFDDVSDEEIEREVAKAIAEVRAERRAARDRAARPA